MLSAIDSPKSKSITIAFVSFKAMILGIVLTSTYNDIANQKNCQDISADATVIQLFFLLGCILDAVAIVYFYLTDHFSRLQYYVFYTYHILLTLYLIVDALTKVSKQFDCSFTHEYIGTVLFLNLNLLASTVIIMWANLYFALKYAHLGSNVVWTFMWIIGGSFCAHGLIALIASIHGLLSISGLVIFIVMIFLRKTSFTEKIWKYLMIFSIGAMLFCFLMCIFELLIPENCQNVSHFRSSYKIFGLIEVISPVLLIIFLKTDVGDPRQLIMKKKQEYFQKWRQNPNIQDDGI